MGWGSRSRNRINLFKPVEIKELLFFINGVDASKKFLWNRRMGLLVRALRPS